jgi:hypothetical protein
LINYSILLIAVGSILWAVIGPAIVLAGIPAPRTSGDDKWWFPEAYAWLTHGGRAPSISEISSTYQLGFFVGIIGLSVLAAGVIGIILVAAREMHACITRKSRNEQRRNENLTELSKEGEPHNVCMHLVV